MMMLTMMMMMKMMMVVAFTLVRPLIDFSFLSALLLLSSKFSRQVLVFLHLI